VSGRLAPVVRLAPAKLNLTLAVLGRRPDGFHALHSVMVPLGLAEVLSLAPAAGSNDTLHVSGADTGPTAENLVLRAIAEARKVARQSLGPSADTPPLSARLEKRIPVAAGLGGGSSDAAAALEGALDAWGLTVPDPDRQAAAARLGSDVPFFLAGGPALVEGRGELVTPLKGISGDSPGVVLVTAALPSSTSAVFAAFDAGGSAAPADPGSTRASSEHLAVELRAGLRAVDLVARAGVLASSNDLTAAAFAVVPGLLALRRALSRLLGRPIGLSGSGPTLWALYPSMDAAVDAAAIVSLALGEGSLVAPGGGPPFVTATSIASPQERSHA
jgi:4-diphosphocytidyl-2-C-methyl-D-erythritol kinase